MEGPGGCGALSSGRHAFGKLGCNLCDMRMLTCNANVNVTHIRRWCLYIGQEGPVKLICHGGLRKGCLSWFKVQYIVSPAISFSPTPLPVLCLYNWVFLLSLCHDPKQREAELLFICKLPQFLQTAEQVWGIGCKLTSPLRCCPAF